jgi:TPR repeat protein
MIWTADLYKAIKLWMVLCFFVTTPSLGQEANNCAGLDNRASDEQILACVMLAYEKSQLSASLQKEYTSLLLRVASRSNMEAIYWLGRLYSEGVWVDKSLEESNNLLIISATDGHINSQILLAENYQSEAKTSQSPDSLVLKSRQWLERATESGSITAKRTLGIHLLSFGQSSADMKKAHLLLQEAARKNDRIAMKRLIEFYGNQYQLTQHNRYLILQKEWQTKISRLDNKDN